MSRVCEMTGKGAMSGKKVSHSNRKSNKKWNANIQKVTMVVDGVERKVKVSTRYLKTMKK
jgi:large subunit ribosomal protein L28